jgi:hypothetical protein
MKLFGKILSIKNAEVKKVKKVVLTREQRLNKAYDEIQELIRDSNEDGEQLILVSTRVEEEDDSIKGIERAFIVGGSSYIAEMILAVCKQDEVFAKAVITASEASIFKQEGLRKFRDKMVGNVSERINSNKVFSKNGKSPIDIEKLLSMSEKEVNEFLDKLTGDIEDED